MSQRNFCALHRHPGRCRDASSPGSSREGRVRQASCRVRSHRPRQKGPRTASGPDEQHPLDIPRLINPSHSVQTYHTKIPIYAHVEQAPTIHQTVKHQMRFLSELNSSTPSLASHLPSKTTVCRSADNPAHAPLWRTFLVDGGNLTSNLTHNIENILHSEKSCECVADGPVPEPIQMYHPRRASTTPETTGRPDDQHKMASI